MKTIRVILASFVAAASISVSAQSDVFSTVDAITNIRQDTTEFVQINHPGIAGNSCASRTFGVLLSTNHPNFRNIYATILTARASGINVQIGVEGSQCAFGFGLVRTVTMRDS